MRQRVRTATGTGRRRSAQAWRGLVRGYADSGLRLEVYCAREGIGMASYFRWRRQLGECGVVRAATARRAAATLIEPAFVDLGAMRPASSRVELRLELGGGMVLRIARS